MEPVRPRWSPRDLQFVVEVLIPEGSDPEHIVDLLQGDEPLLDAMLADERLFRQMMADEELQASVSPAFFFKVLLLRARHDLERESYTIERRHLQKVVLFDAQRVVELLYRRDVIDYLAAMLASFTRVHSTTIPIRVRAGVWRRIHVNDLNVDSLIQYAQMIEEEHRFTIYQRIGDACLFLTGIFPDHIEARQRYPHRSQPRFRLNSSLLQSLEDYEAYGRTFYGLAARHEAARVERRDRVLQLLSEQFILAGKPLTYLSERYLSLRKHRLFDVGPHD